MSYNKSVKEYNNIIREVDLNGVLVGGQNALTFMNSETKKSFNQLVVGEVITNIPDNYPDMLKKDFSDNSFADNVETMLKADISALAVRFNIENCDDIDSEISKSKEQLQEVLKITDLPLFIIGTFRRDIDVKLLTELARTADRKCTIGTVEEDNYKAIAPVVSEYGHNIIARTPIDINLTKQLNILLSEVGVDLNQILIDPNTGALGYGLDYAYSIIERIKIAALEGDHMLNMPILTFVGEEAWKTKEAKSQNVPSEWGDNTERALMWETATAGSMITAGADIVVMRHIDAIKAVSSFIQQIK